MLDRYIGIKLRSSCYYVNTDTADSARRIHHVSGGRFSRCPWNICHHIRSNLSFIAATVAVDSFSSWILSPSRLSHLIRLIKYSSHIFLSQPAKNVKFSNVNICWFSLSFTPLNKCPYFHTLHSLHNELPRHKAMQSITIVINHYKPHRQNF